MEKINFVELKLRTQSRAKRKKKSLYKSCSCHFYKQNVYRWEVKAKCIINATGPFTDHIRKMDDPTVQTICCPSSGVHIVLPGYYSPQQMGLLDPSTSDGRVIFFLPWLNQTIAGTTDLPCDV